MAEYAMKGVWDHMYRGERYVSAHMLISDDELGIVGIVGLTRQRPA